MSQTLKRGDIVRLEDGSMYGVIEKDVTDPEQSAEIIFVKINGELGLMDCEQDDLFIIDGLDSESENMLSAIMKLTCRISGVYKGEMSAYTLDAALRQYRRLISRSYPNRKWDEVKMMANLEIVTADIDKSLELLNIRYK